MINSTGTWQGCNYNTICHSFWITHFCTWVQSPFHTIYCKVMFPFRMNYTSHQCCHNGIFITTSNNLTAWDSCVLLSAPGVRVTMATTQISRKCRFPPMHNICPSPSSSAPFLSFISLTSFYTFLPLSTSSVFIHTCSLIAISFYSSLTPLSFPLLSLH